MKKITNTATSEIIIKIQSKMPKFSPALHKLARYVIDNIEKMDGIQINQLSNESGVSEATITRFVKEIGFKNFHSFLIQIAKVNTNQKQTHFSFSSIEEGDNPNTICQKIFTKNLQTITDTLSIIKSEEVKKAAEAIAGAKRVMIFAQGRSEVTARSIRLRLQRLNILADTFIDSHEGAIASSLSGKEDVAIGISTFGRSKMVVNNLQRAKEHGAATIAITSYEDVPLGAYADIVLMTVNNDNVKFGIEPSCATVTQMILLDCIYIMIYLLDKEKSDSYVEVTLEAINQEKI